MESAHMEVLRFLFLVGQRYFFGDDQPPVVFFEGLGGH